ncbi:coiled-coil domain-containing protein 97 [Neocloeon triangulifer]|uniref:coiled-coil domain-containing protein 97 n=1 Tax=Neocloeon triangulifer TaxID=2078957 RepID=UPI00286F5349|nr:coiled-coil domain-containing protein 97 [Neocloeon triangulifer]
MCLEGTVSARLFSQIVQHVSVSPAIVKSEQRDDPEMDFTERAKIVEEILSSHPERFLERFGSHLIEEHLCYFQNLDCAEGGEYSIKFHVDQIQKRLADKKNVLVKNRRYAALKKLVKEGSYFSETEMKSRNPLLYDQLVGQHMTEDETYERDRANFQNMTLATFLMARFDKEAEANLHQFQQDREEAAMEESDEDSDEEEMPERKEPNEDEDERLLFRQEFVTHMYNSFLRGQDKDFDYSSVDQNADYDDMSAKERDEEDSYFDSETPVTVIKSESAASTVESEEDELEAFMRTLPPTEKQVDS